jgi:hypothetical protein
MYRYMCLDWGELGGGGGGEPAEKVGSGVCFLNCVPTC